MTNSVTVVQRSDNTKTGRIATTYAAQASCPVSCPFRNSGCYAESGYVGYVTSRLNKSKDGPIRIARKEAEGIRRLKGNRPMRLHVVGDSSTSETARIVSKAAEEYMEKGGQKVWTYTHARIPRAAWGKVSVLRSTHTLRQVESAFEAGYAAALTVKDFQDTKAYPMGRGIIGIPCPAQTRKGVTCESCQLCTRDEYLRKKKMVVLFKAHGIGIRKAMKHAYGKSA